jgi:tRNA(Ile)-lysidine synthase
MREIFTDYINELLELNQISWDAGFVLAISGGVDSMVLLDNMRVPYYDQVVAHVNYNLRPDSYLEVEMLKAYCEEWELELEILEVPKSHWDHFEGNIQEEARRLRYDFFQKLKIKHQFQYIVTAHHAGDAQESFFINLMRGSGLDGISGWDVVKGDRFRPLLEFSKEEIVAHAIQYKIEWCEDSSNQTPKYLRNRIRNELFPLMMDIDPRKGAGLQRTIQHMRTAKDALTWAYEFWKTHQIEEITNGYRITWASQREVFFVAKFLSDFVRLHPNEVYDLMDGLQSRVAITYGDCKIQRIQNGLLLYPNLKLAPPVNMELRSFSFGFAGTFMYFEFETSEDPIEFEPDTLYLDADLLPDVMHLRSIAPGDRFQPLGLVGTKKVNDYLSDRKVGHMEKQKTLVLWAHQKIVAVLPYQIDDAFRVSSQTRKFLIIKKYLPQTK